MSHENNQETQRLKKANFNSVADARAFALKRQEFHNEMHGHKTRADVVAIFKTKP